MIDLLYTLGRRPLVVVPAGKTVELCGFLNKIGIHYSVDYGGFCDDNILEFRMGCDVILLSLILNKLNSLG